MKKNNKIVHSNLVLAVFILFLFSLICSPALAKKYPTSTVIKNVNVNGDTEINIVLPWGVLVSGQVTDSQGVPLKDVVVTAIGKNFLINNTSITDNKGNYKVSLLKDTYDFTFLPTSNESRAVYKNIENVIVKGNKKLNAALDDGVFLSGSCFDFLNQPVTDSIIYTVNLSDDWPSLFPPDPITGQFKGPLPVGEYDIVAVRSSNVNLPFINYRTHTNISLGKKNIQKDTKLDNIKMPKGVVLQGNVKDKNNQTISVVITLLNYDDLKAKNPWAGAQTASNSAIDSVYKAALEKKNVYALQVVPLHGEGSPINAVNKKATFKIISKVKMKNKDKTFNITLDNGNILSGTITDKNGKIVKNVPVIITNIRKMADLFNKTKIILVTAANANGKYSYPVPKGNYDVYAYSPDLYQSASEVNLDWDELYTDEKRIQDHVIHFLRTLRNNSTTGSIRK